MNEKEDWVDGYLQWKSQLSKDDYQTYCKDRVYNCDVPVKGSLPPCECGEDEERYRPLTDQEDQNVSWVWELIRSYEQ